MEPLADWSTRRKTRWIDIEHEFSENVDGSTSLSGGSFWAYVGMMVNCCILIMVYISFMRFLVGIVNGRFCGG